MNRLPEKFPEYSIMFKTISNHVRLLEKQKQNVNDEEKKELEKKIHKYNIELDKIKKMFPDNFFESNYS